MNDKAGEAYHQIIVVVHQHDFETHIKSVPFQSILWQPAFASEDSEDGLVQRIWDSALRSQWQLRALQAPCAGLRTV